MILSTGIPIVSPQRQARTPINIKESIIFLTILLNLSMFLFLNKLFKLVIIGTTI